MAERDFENLPLVEKIKKEPKQKAILRFRTHLKKVSWLNSGHFYLRGGRLFVLLLEPLRLPFEQLQKIEKKLKKEIVSSVKESTTPGEKQRIWEKLGDFVNSFEAVLGRLIEDEVVPFKRRWIEITSSLLSETERDLKRMTKFSVFPDEIGDPKALIRDLKERLERVKVIAKAVRLGSKDCSPKGKVSMLTLEAYGIPSVKVYQEVIGNAKKFERYLVEKLNDQKSSMREKAYIAYLLGVMEHESSDIPRKFKRFFNKGKQLGTAVSPPLCFLYLYEFPEYLDDFLRVWKKLKKKEREEFESLLVGVRLLKSKLRPPHRVIAEMLRKVKEISEYYRELATVNAKYLAFVAGDIEIIPEYLDFFRGLYSYYFNCNSHNKTLRLLEELMVTQNIYFPFDEAREFDEVIEYIHLLITFFELFESPKKLKYFLGVFAKFPMLVRNRFDEITLIGWILKKAEPEVVDYFLENHGATLLAAALIFNPSWVSHLSKVLEGYNKKFFPNFHFPYADIIFKNIPFLTLYPPIIPEIMVEYASVLREKVMEGDLPILSKKMVEDWIVELRVNERDLVFFYKVIHELHDYMVFFDVRGERVDWYGFVMHLLDIPPNFENIFLWINSPILPHPKSYSISGQLFNSLFVVPEYFVKFAWRLQSLTYSQIDVSLIRDVVERIEQKKFVEFAFDTIFLVYWQDQVQYIKDWKTLVKPFVKIILKNLNVNDLRKLSKVELYEERFRRALKWIEQFPHLRERIFLSLSNRMRQIVEFLLEVGRFPAWHHSNMRRILFEFDDLLSKSPKKRLPGEYRRIWANRNREIYEQLVRYYHFTLIGGKVPTISENLMKIVERKERLKREREDIEITIREAMDERKLRELNLRKRGIDQILSNEEKLSSWIERDLLKTVRSMANEAFFDALVGFRMYLYSAISRSLFGKPLPLEDVNNFLWRNAMDLAFSLRKHQKIYRRLLRERQRGDFQRWVLSFQSNRDFLKRLEREGINLEPWISGYRESRTIKVNGEKIDVEVFLSLDPLEVLAMGTLFRTCLEPGGVYDFSVIEYAVALNKRVIFVKRQGNEPLDRSVIARMIIAINESNEMVRYPMYLKDGYDYEVLAKCVISFSRNLANLMGINQSTGGRVSGLILKAWWSDGIVPWHTW